MADSTQTDRKVVDRFIEQYTKSFVDRDLDSFVDLHDENVVCLPPGQQPIMAKMRGVNGYPVGGIV